MFEFLTDDEHAITILKDDHKVVKELFDRFEKAETRREKESIARECLKELKIHATIEEEIFYPAVRMFVDTEVMNEADEEHHVAKILIAELDNLDPADEHFDAKFTVLAESVRHHIKEEEKNMLPQVENLDVDLEVLGQEMLARKNQLQDGRIPPSREEMMVSKKGATSSRSHSPRAHTSRSKPKTARSRKSKTHMHPRANGHETRTRT